MDPTSDIAAAGLALGDEGEDLWGQLLPHLSPALSGDPAPFLDALEAAGRGRRSHQESAHRDAARRVVRR